jgi:hypothetical protein
MGGWVSRSGSAGVDHSANAATVPAAGYNGTPVLTIALNKQRNSLGIENQTAGTIAFVRDDGLGNNQTTRFLVAGASWTSDTFKGRVRVYTTSGAGQVSAWED